ncbi:uncharacterized protein RAG0_09217 [Rhynchosporium agropyri]|uniref:NACHT domain-containing protein n=1 Tax=Rhynchosporium agropyri TaxID=914238 RepID=A0A1E1KUD8_9HELO|nr:uncharacterized protein RAG0_09217 [Rhynchosporium agropyri]
MSLSLSGESEWTRAVKLYNTTLTDDPRKRIPDDPVAVELMFGTPIKKLDELIDYTRSAKEKVDAGRSKFMKHIDNLLQWFNKYAIIADIMIQHQPSITALVWGAVRGLLVVAVRDIEVSDKIGSNILSVLYHIGRWEEYLHLHPASARLSTIIIELFAHLISFLVRSKRFYEINPAKRYVKAAFSAFNEKIDGTLRKVAELADAAEREAHLASQQEQNRQWKAVASERTEQAGFREAQNGAMANINSKCDTIMEDIQGLANETLPGVISHLAKEANIKIFYETRKEVIKWLRPEYTGSYPTTDWEEGTCQWITKHEKFRTWKLGGTGSVLWIHGIPGCGKSVISSFLTAHGFAFNEAPFGVLTYYFQKTDEASSPSAMVCSLLGKMLHHPGIVETLSLYKAVATLGSYLSRYKTGTECQISITWGVLQALLEKSDEFAMIVDGIDECTNAEDVKALLGHMADLARFPHAHVILASRYREEFQKALRDPLEIPMEATQIDADIRVMIRAKVKEHPAQLAHLGVELEAKCDRDANGMFLWAKLMVDDLLATLNKRTQRRKLEMFPSGLHALYDQFMQTSGKGIDAAHLRTRREIFSLLTGCFVSLTVDEISEALCLDVRGLRVDEGLRIFDMDRVLQQLCMPLIVIRNRSVTLIHASVRDYFVRTRKPDQPSLTYLTLDVEATHMYILRKCLCILMLPDFAEDSMVAATLRNCVLLETGSGDSHELSKGTEIVSRLLEGFYRYAALHWHLHLTATSQASQICLKMIAKFLKSRQLVTWSEAIFLLGDGHHGSPAMEISSDLKSWLALQPPSTHQIVEMHHFMQTSFIDLTDEFEKTKKYPLELAFLNSRYAAYFAWTGNLSPQGFQLLVLAAEGLERELGRSNQLTLNAHEALATGLLARGYHAQSSESLTRIRQERVQLVGPDHRDIFKTLSYECLCHFHLLNFAAAEACGNEAAKGLLLTGLPSTRDYLHQQLYLGYALEAQGKNAQALECYERAYALWIDLNGPNDPSTLMTQSAMASAYRKLGRLQDAERHYVLCFAGRQRSLGLDHYTCMDIAVSLSYVYREMGRVEEALALMELCASLDGLQKPENFERFCQVNHLQALLLGTDQDTKHEAEYKLQTTLKRRDDEWLRDNRETMWIRLTLALWYRNRGDSESAAQLFQGIVQQKEDCETAFEGKVLGEHAERAIRLVKCGRVDNAKQFLNLHRLKWSRAADFEIQYGGPMTDSAWERAFVE